MSLVGHPSAVLQALIGMLAGDATLKAMAPDGVFLDVGAHGATKFIVVSPFHYERVAIFREQGDEVFNFMVKPVIMGPSPAAAMQAADRIHELIAMRPAPGRPALTPVGYIVLDQSLMDFHPYQEIDVQTDQRWQHGVQMFEIVAQPVEATP